MNSNGYFSDESDIACEILNYLVEHPNSQDTLDGILQWWLLDREIKYQHTKVKEAIAGLIARGFLMDHGSIGSTRRYGLNQIKIKEIQEFINEKIDDK